MKLLVSVLFGAATVSELVYSIVAINEGVAIIQIIASVIELFSLVRSDSLRLTRNLLLTQTAYL